MNTAEHSNAYKAKEIFTSFLEKNNHRKTPERFAILDAIYNLSGHFEIDALHHKMNQANYPVSKATLYNTVELLIACDLVTRHQFSKNTAHYEKSLSNKQHDHIIMIDNGEVEEFCDPRIQNIKSTLEDLFDIEILHHSLNFYARKKNNKNITPK